MSDTTDPVAVLGAAILNAIVDTNRDSEGYAVINSENAVKALTLSLAMILEAEPGVASPKEMREVAEAFGKNLRMQIRTLRAAYEATGKRAWDATPVRMN